MTDTPGEKVMGMMLAGAAISSVVVAAIGLVRIVEERGDHREAVNRTREANRELVRQCAATARLTAERFDKERRRIRKGSGVETAVK